MTTPQSILRTMNLIYFTMVGILTAFALVVFIQNTIGIIILVGPDLSLEFRYLLFTITPLSLFIGYILFKKQLTTPVSATLIQKLKKYNQAILIRSACFEFPGLVAGLAAILSKDNSFLLFTALIAVLYLLYRPTINSITIDLNLSQPERSQLESQQKP